MGKTNTSKPPNASDPLLEEEKPRHPLIRDLNHADKKVLSKITRTFATYGANGSPDPASLMSPFSYIARSDDGSVWLSWGAAVKKRGENWEVVLDVVFVIEREELTVKLRHTWSTKEWLIIGCSRPSLQERLRILCGITPPVNGEVPLRESDWFRVIDALGRSWRELSKQSSLPKSRAVTRAHP